VLYIRIRDIPVAIISLVIALPLVFWLLPILIDRKWSEAPLFLVFVLIVLLSLVVGTFLWNQVRKFVAYLDRPRH